MTPEQRTEMSEVLDSLGQADLAEVAGMAISRVTNRDRLLDLNRSINDCLSAARHREVAEAKARLVRGATAEIQGVRDKGVNGIRVQILKINRTRADVKTIDHSPKYPKGTLVTVPLNCLVSVD